MVDGKGLARSAHATHHFVGNQENLVAPAYFRDPLDITVGWRDSAERGSHHRLKNEGSDILRSLALEQTVEFIGAIDIAGWVFETKRAAVAIARAQCVPIPATLGQKARGDERCPKPRGRRATRHGSSGNAI